MTPRASGVEVLLQAVSPVSEDVVWVSGHGGTWLRSVDGGASWAGGVVPGADTLQFRDVHAVTADSAWLLAAGPGDMSRIYRTTDGGASWELQWTNPQPEGFYDCLAFFDGRRGLAYGDAVDGALRVLRTLDAGRSWVPVPAAVLPAALPGEGGFAASGTCVAVAPDGSAWIATGNAATARVLSSRDAGGTWTAAAAPVVAGEAAGLTSVAFRDARHGLAVGGDLARTADRTANVAISEDGGATWIEGGRLRMPGAAYGVAWVPGTDPAVAVAVGPGGADVSRDGGRTWTALADGAWWGLAFASPRAGWLVGPDGRIATVRIP